MPTEVDTLVSLGEEPIRPLKRIEYEYLADRGSFQDEKVELLFGMVVPMAPVDVAHGTAIAELMRLLIGKIAGRAQVRCQTPFAASETSEPEPDIYVVPVGAYWTGDHPDHALAVLEVARSSLKRDRNVKTKLYALANVGEYWIGNHVDGVIEVNRDRQVDGTWRTCMVHQRGNSVALLAFPDVAIAVDDVVPPIGS